MTSTTLEPAPEPSPERSPAAPATPARPDAGRRDASRAPRGGLHRLRRGRDRDPVWVRPCLLALLLGTAVLYLWGLGASGWANTYYAAAVQAGTKSWKAFFFGSFDASNAVTVDKSPLFLWPMELSARVFGLSSWSILVPQALEGVAAVGVLYLAVRRWFSAASALLAGAVLALTPVAALMFRFNNPDAALVLLMVVGAYAMIRALERGSTWWLVFAFSAIGFGFLAKMLQALLVVPAFGLVYLIAAPVSTWKRIWQLTLACGALLVSAGWWIAIVELWPASSRPYIGGSQHNSVLELIFGYNGFGRLTGNETGSVGGGGLGGNGGQWGPTGLTRMFNAEFGSQISWLLPAALILLVAGLVWRGTRPRTDRVRAAFILWGGWLLVTALVFSLGKGIIHQYYAIALAPAIGALVGMGAGMLWKRRAEVTARSVLAVAVAATAIWGFVLLGRTPNWNSWLRGPLLLAGIAVAIVLLAAHLVHGRALVGVAIAAVFVIVAAPAAYTLDTVNTPHTGAIPTAGPAGASTMGFGAAPGGFGGRFPGAGQLPGAVNGGQGPGGFTGGLPGGAGGGAAGAPAGGSAGGAGGLLDGSRPDSALTTLLSKDASSYRWVAATIGANEAGGYQLATDDPVMAIGGFNGTDPTPTLAQFQQYVREGTIHYFISGGRFGGGGFGGGRFGGGGGASTSSAISSWVSANFTSETVGGVTVYDLTSSST
jgi:4-amino-4-deoxy-L-arabinose transferase-like glycosyltransferase